MSGALTLPWAVLAQDNHRLIPARGRLIASSGYREAKRQAATLLTLHWRGPTYARPVEVHGRAFFPDNRKRDAGNYRKLITDALTGIAYTDDSLVHREVWERAGIDRTNPRIEITVTPMPCPASTPCSTPTGAATSAAPPPARSDTTPTDAPNGTTTQFPPLPRESQMTAPFLVPLDDLTPRQIEVVTLLARGYTDKWIASQLGMQYSTVRVHVAAIAFRLGLPGDSHTRVMIARWWLAQHPESLDGAA